MAVRTSFDHLTKPPRRRRFGGGAIAGIVVLLLVAGLAVYGLVHHGNTKPTTASTGSISPTSTPTATPTSASSTSQMPGAPAGVAVGGQVVPGLWAGTATVTSGSHSVTLGGIPVAWPRTVDGAIGAAMDYEAHAMNTASLVTASARKIDPRIYTKQGMTLAAYTPAQLAAVRKALHLSDAGVAVGSNGKPDKNLAYLGGGEPRYGAYKVTSVKTDQSGAPTEVRLYVMVPTWAGTSNKGNLSGVKLYFRSVAFVMQWADGPTGGPEDWRIQDTPTADTLTAPASARTVSNMGYQNLHTMLGDGWCVPADATDKRLAGAVFAR